MIRRCDPSRRRDAERSFAPAVSGGPACLALSFPEVARSGVRARGSLNHQRLGKWPRLVGAGKKPDTRLMPPDVW